MDIEISIIINGEEKWFCSDGCLAKYEKFKSFRSKIEQLFNDYNGYTSIGEVIEIYRGVYPAGKIRLFIYELINKGIIEKDRHGFLYPANKKEVILPAQGKSQINV